MTEEKKMQVSFAPGAFDQFDGTQEELDELVAMIQHMVDSGELEDNARELTEEDFAELPDNIKQQLIDSIELDVPRKLQ